MKHNNALPNVHFRKDWQRYIKTWFDQPAKKQARRAHRVSKAKKVAPRPLNLLRPVVRGQTVRYNNKLRLGRGFSLDELEAAGINRKAALGLGIAIDWRRRNKNTEDLDRNVERLQAYKTKLVVFPRKTNSKRVKAGDASADALAQAKQVVCKNVIALPSTKVVVETRAITDEERSADVYGTLRNNRTIAKLWGIREKRQRDKEVEKVEKSKSNQ